MTPSRVVQERVAAQAIAIAMEMRTNDRVAGKMVSYAKAACQVRRCHLAVYSRSSDIFLGQGASLPMQQHLPAHL